MEAPVTKPVHANFRKVWAPQEDQILQREAELQLRNGSLRDWKLIATKLPDRTNKDCRKRWSKICDSVNKGPWKPREDKLLEEAIAEVGPHTECAKRWRHFLDPDLDHSRWEAEDDARLCAAVLKYGSNWRKVVEEEFPERSPTNVKNRYAVIKNLRRRRKDSAATPASFDVAGDIESSSSQFTSGANDGGQTPTSANPNTYTADTDSFLDFENAIYSAGAGDDDFDIFLHESLSPQTPTSRFASDTNCATLAPVSATHLQRGSNATMSSVENQSLDGTHYDVSASLALEEFPQAELGVTNNIRDEAQHQMLWEPRDDSLTARGAQSTMEDLNGETAILQHNATLNDAAHGGGEARRVSLFLEDMQPETANRVTSMLLNSNVDVKMRMTVK
ncbi:MAG: hypothetical protein Q9163_002850 [Psora crenata]